MTNTLSYYYLVLITSLIVQPPMVILPITNYDRKKFYGTSPFRKKTHPVCNLAQKWCHDTQHNDTKNKGSPIILSVIMLCVI